MAAVILDSEVFERALPQLRWRTVLIAMSLLTVLIVGAWEWKMRAMGLHAGDLGDGKEFWAVERRKVDSGPRDQVVLVGDSRILLDTDLDIWRQLTGVRPIQLALQGTGAAPFFHDIANDEHFAGLVVLGITEPSYMRAGPGGGIYGDVLGYFRTESLSARFGHQVYVGLARVFAFLDDDYKLFTLIRDLPLPNRAGVPPQFHGLGKLAESYDNRQNVMWPNYARAPSTPPIFGASGGGPFSSGQAPPAGMPASGPPGGSAKPWAKSGSAKSPFEITDETIAQAIADTKADVDRIRKRGGEVVLIRPPSSGKDLEMERAMTPRAQVWDRLVKTTQTYSIHWEDYPDMQGLSLPDMSHLAGADQKKFTRAYVALLCKHVDWLHAHTRECRSGWEEYNGLSGVPPARPEPRD